MLARDSTLYQEHYDSQSLWLGLFFRCLLPKRMPAASFTMRKAFKEKWQKEGLLKYRMQSLHPLLYPVIAPFYALLGILQAYRDMPRFKNRVLWRVAHVLFCMIGVFTNFLVHVIWDWLLFPISYPIFLYTYRAQLSQGAECAAIVLYAAIMALIVLVVIGLMEPTTSGLHAFATVLGTPFVPLFEFFAQNPAIALSALSIFMVGMVASLLVFWCQKKYKHAFIESMFSKIYKRIDIEAPTDNASNNFGFQQMPKLSEEFPQTNKVGQTGFLDKRGGLFLIEVRDHYDIYATDFDLAQTNQLNKYIGKYTQTRPLDIDENNGVNIYTPLKKNTNKKKTDKNDPLIELNHEGKGSKTDHLKIYLDDSRGKQNSYGTIVTNFNKKMRLSPLVNLVSSDFGKGVKTDATAKTPAF